MVLFSRKHALVVLLSFALPLSAVAGKAQPPSVSFDGMELVNHSRSSHVYRKADANFSSYNKIMLLPSTTAFKKSYKQDYNRSASIGTARIRDKDIERMKKTIAETFDTVFAEEIAKVAGYTLVTEAGQGVVIVKPMLINLDAHAPDLRTAGNVKTYVETAGEGTLYLEFFDAVSGEILARAVDARETRDNGFYSWATIVSNKADTRALVRSWAKKLSNKLVEVSQK